jgi:hypothetical protein
MLFGRFLSHSKITLSGQLASAYQIREVLSLGTYVIPSLKRGEDGRFKDSDLAELIKNGCVIMPNYVRHCD